MSELPESLPRRTHLTFAKLLEEETVSIGDLRERVSGYLATVEQASQENGLLDHIAARALGEAMLLLIASCHADHPNYVQAAVSYFIDCDDAEHDMDSLSGFDDDIGVFNAVCDHLGHSGLKLLP